MSAANAYPQDVVAAFARLCKCQATVEAARGQFLGQTVSASARKRSALKAAQTKASKAFARACYAAGFADAQAVADELTKAEEQALRLGILNEVERLQQEKAAKATKRCPLCGAELELHIDGTVSTPFFPKYPIRGAALPRREREAPFYACPSCEHCEEVSA